MFFLSLNMPQTSISFYVIICAIAAAFCSRLPVSTATNNITDREALLQIKADITDDPLGVMSSWNDTLHFCNWYGVSCSRRHHQRVTELWLGSSKLTGTISPYIGNLSFLRVLNLLNNTLTGTIPPNISTCSRLNHLYLGQNKLVGEIPSDVGSLQQLEYLDMEDNHLTGLMPASLGNLSSLSTLYLGQNMLSGVVPNSLSKLKNLVDLTLHGNNLSGIVPSFIFNHSTIQTIDLGVNNFRGSLPPDMGFKLPNLTFFSIYQNMFTGTIPASVSNLTKLAFLQTDYNSLHGQVPSLLKLQKLRVLNLASNSLGNGVLDTDLDFVSTLANATRLTILAIGGNKLRGTFPQIICNFSSIRILYFEENQISGQIPSCIENLEKLEDVECGQNRLSGSIPPSIGKLQYLGILTLEGNHLSGSIPPSIGNLTQLNQLDLSQNNLQGNIPLALGKCRYLDSLILSQNKLDGRIPIQILSLNTLSIELNLSHNHLSGSLPAAIGQLTSLGTLDLSENMLSGELPSTLAACTGLEMLYLQGNHFQGDINNAFQTLVGLCVLDLSRNDLSGKIPKYLASLQLQNLNISYNKLEGEVPSGGVFNNATALSLLGNNKLCGGKPQFQLPRCDFNRIQPRRSGHRKRLLFAIRFGILGIVFLAALVSLYAFWYCMRKKEPRTLSDSDKFQNLSFQNLQRATNGFSAENVIGRGAFGVVYKGTLDQERGLVAIKIFNHEMCGAFKSFLAECEVLRNIRHRNLVKVITACSSVDYQGNDFTALVYEYMVNGSLEGWLHPGEETSGNEGSNSAKRGLSFQQRLDIVVDVAFALEYLHHNYGESIVHCDLKPSNVLLDEDFIAHVSDFGLAKILTEGISSSAVNHSSSVGVRGTIGYTPPEYGLGNGVSTSGDVYSFGILLLEMFTGKRPTDDRFSEGLSLHQYVKATSPDEVTKILDDTISEAITEDQTNNTASLEAVISIFELAISCTAELPQERLNMSDVASRLSSIRTKLEGLHLQQKRRRIPSGTNSFTQK